MNKIIPIEKLTPEACIQLMEGFWRDQTEAVRTREGLALSLPLMYPDGLQVTVFIEPTAPGYLRLSDRGKTLGPLVEAGMNLDAKLTGILLNERVQMFELQRQGLVLIKDLREPLQGIDIQLFAESLVSISHLIYRNEPEAMIDTVADQTVRTIFRERQLRPIEGALLPGRIEKKIKVDYYLDSRRPLAMEVIKRRGTNLGYIEQWAWRWTDLKNRNQKLLSAMVYDPDVQPFDAPILDIGNSVCDLFCPYFETDRINSFMRKAVE